MKTGRFFIQVNKMSKKLVSKVINSLKVTLKNAQVKLN